MVESAVVASGLDGIIVAETQISEVDGQNGKLIIRGRDAEELAFNSTFEETCALLWAQDGEPIASITELEREFATARLKAFEMIKTNATLLSQPNPMDAVRTATSFLTLDAPQDRAQFVQITAAIGVFASNWSRVQKGLPIMPPNTKLSIAADFLRTVRNHEPPSVEVQALDTYLTTVSDHGMNASTFTARVVASTESDTVSCVVSAIGALKGPLHGGAPGPVLDMLAEIGRAEDAEKWLVRELDAGKRIMGMGHRIYRVRDPRAAIFERALQSLEKGGISTTRLPLARAVENKAEEILAKRHPERPLKANVEFYTAVLLDALHIPHDLFTAVFAAGRVAGWCAHIKEQGAHGRLIRPASKYVGPYPR
jgi:citrate synthase